MNIVVRKTTNLILMHGVRKREKGKGRQSKG